MDMNYAEDLAIDPNELEEEWLRQPILYAKWAEKYRDSQENYKSEKSRLTLDIKLNPENYLKKGEKITDKTTEALLFNKAEFIAAKKERDVLKIAVKAFEQRKTALENEVKLFGMEYFSTPRELNKQIDSGKRFDPEKQSRKREIRRRTEVTTECKK